MPQLSARFTVPVTLAVLALLLGFASSYSVPGIPDTPRADAHGSAGSADGDLLGYAWSDTFGWISFSCENDGSCAAGNWGVTIDTTTGGVTGYAWSSNLGWVDFNNPDLTGCGAGASAVSYDVVNKKLVGFARAVSLVGAPVPVAGGADGCIKLDPDPPTAEVYLRPVNATLDVFEGFAWDASLPGGVAPGVGVGWIDFCPMESGVMSESNCVHPRAKINTNMLGVPQLWADPVRVAVSGDSTTIYWDANDPEYDSCAVVQGAAAGFVITGGAVSGNDLSGPITGPTTFQIECTDAATSQTNLSAPITVSVMPILPECSDGIDNEPDGRTDFPNDPGCSDTNDDSEEDVDAVFTVTPPRVRAGGTVTADWDVTGGTVDSCTLVQSGGGLNIAIPSGNLTGGLSEESGIVVNNSSQSLFTLTCSDGSGGLVLTRSVRVVVISPITPQ